MTPPSGPTALLVLLVGSAIAAVLVIACAVAAGIEDDYHWRQG